jgi:cytochrome c551/c552
MKKLLLIIIFIIVAIAINPLDSHAFAGKQLFKKEQCILCHAINKKGGTMGPNLSAIGKIRSYSWIRKQIRNPKLDFFTPNSFVIFHGKIYKSIMPANKKISADNLNKLAQYLKSLK